MATWLGATTGQLPASGQINQFLTTHPSTLVYTGLSLGSAAVGSGTVASNGLYNAMSFLPGSNQSPGRFVLTMSVTGTPAPLTLTIQTNNSGAPSGTVLAATVVPYVYLTGSATATSIPLPCSFISGTTYWLVAGAVGDGSDFYSFSKSSAASGASTSTNGTSWTAQTYGLAYARFDQSAVLPLMHTWEDSGARWTTWESSANIPTGIQEYTVAQGTNQYVYSSRTLVYTNHGVTSIS